MPWITNFSSTISIFFQIPVVIGMAIGLLKLPFELFLKFVRRAEPARFVFLIKILPLLAFCCLVANALYFIELRNDPFVSDQLKGERPLAILNFYPETLLEESCKECTTGNVTRYPSAAELNRRVALFRLSLVIAALAIFPVLIMNGVAGYGSAWNQDETRRVHMKTLSTFHLHLCSALIVILFYL